MTDSADSTDVRLADAREAAIAFEIAELQSQVLQLEHGLNVSTEATAAYAINVVGRARSLAAELAVPLADVEARAKAILKDIVAEVGPVHTPYGSAYKAKDGKTVSYDSDALDKLCAGFPDLARILSPYRSEKPTKGAFTVKPKGG